jgi:hypothetical protein
MKKMQKRKISRELPAVGTILKGKFHGKLYEAKIVKSSSSPIGREIKYNNKLFPSMTAAAKAITKNPVNGWRFWKF